MLRDAARALADAAGELGQSLGVAGGQAEAGVTKGLLAAAQALAQASAWVEQRARPLSTREQLLAQAARLFAERGYAGVSLEDIAQAAGFTKGAVYSHFGSKEQTFLATLRSVVDGLRGAVAACEAGIDTGADDGAHTESPPGEQRPDPAVQLSSSSIAGAVALAVEAMQFGSRVPDRRDEVRELVAELTSAIAAAERRLIQEEASRGVATGATPAPDAERDPRERELDRDEALVAELAMRTLLLGLARPDER